MAAKKTVGDLIKEARTNAGLSQTALAAKVDGVSASDIGKAERGEKELPQAALKQIAKATGVTQKSLLDAAAGASAKKTDAAAKKKETAAKKAAATAAKKTTSAAKKTASAAKKATSTAKKTSSSSTSVKVTAAEKKLLELYRAADSDKKKAAVSILKGETPEAGDILSSLLGGAMDMLTNLGKKDK